MQLEQNFVLPMPPDQAWAAFQQVDLLVDCLPGAALTGAVTEGMLPLRFDVKLGPIAASFTGSGQVHYDEADRSGRFEGSASDRRTLSRVKGAAEFSVAGVPEGTRVEVRVDYQITGALAQFGRTGIVRELAAALTAQFAGNLAQRLQGAPAPEAAQPLQAGSLLREALRPRWLRRADDPAAPAADTASGQPPSTSSHKEVKS